MNQAVLSTVWDLGGPAIELLADCSGVLILLAAGFLVFCTFRKRYLLAWILGWSFYLLYRVATASFSLIVTPGWLIAVSQGAYACAIARFVSAILYYTRTLAVSHAAGGRGRVFVDMQRFAPLQSGVLCFRGTYESLKWFCKCS